MLINLIGFQICWLGLVYFGNYFIPVAFALLALHLRIMSKNQSELLLIFSVAIIGSTIDYLLVKCGLFSFDSSQSIPLWLMTLWLCFGATIAHSLSHLRCSLIIQMLIGALFAPLSYLAGYQLNAVNFSYSITTTYLVLSGVWATLMVIFFKLDNLFLSGEIQHG